MNMLFYNDPVIEVFYFFRINPAVFCFPSIQQESVSARCFTAHTAEQAKQLVKIKSTRNEC